MPRPTQLPINEGGVLEALERRDRPLLAPELAELLRASVGKIYRLARQGVLPSYRVGNTVQFDGALVARRLRGER